MRARETLLGAGSALSRGERADLLAQHLSPCPSPHGRGDASLDVSMRLLAKFPLGAEA